MVVRFRIARQGRGDAGINTAIVYGRSQLRHLRIPLFHSRDHCVDLSSIELSRVGSSRHACIPHHECVNTADTRIIVVAHLRTPDQQSQEVVPISRVGGIIYRVASRKFKSVGGET